jgi:hypothetical protein
MKKIVLILVLIISVNTYSQVIKYYSDYYSYKSLVSKNVWTDWTDWERYDAKIKIDLNRDTITIDSSKYYIDKCIETIIDSNSKTIKYAVISYNNKSCFIRIREQEDGIKQLYVDYDNIVRVYNLVY